MHTGGCALLLIRLAKRSLLFAMTNYGAWDSKASRLVQEAEEEDAKEKEAADKALGLDGGPEGPPVAKAKQQRKEMEEHSEEKKTFIEWHKKIQDEVSFTHQPQEEPVELSGSEVEGRSVRLTGSTRTTYVLPKELSIKKLIVERCVGVTVHVSCKIPTSTVDVCRCENLELHFTDPIGTVQADECAGAVALRYSEYDHVGAVYHQNCPGLSIGWAAAELVSVGQPGDFQLSTRRRAGSSDELITQAVRRGEGDFPVDMGSSVDGTVNPVESVQPEPERAPEAEERSRLAQAKREQGNELFRASDFMQAAAEYSMALELDPSLDPVWANRSQCWLRMGDHDKALADAVRCTEVNPLNSKGWFRKGMAYHAMERYIDAVPALLEAEKIEPKNKQIQDAIKMAQLKARFQAEGR